MMTESFKQMNQWSSKNEEFLWVSCRVPWFGRCNRPWCRLPLPPGALNVVRDPEDMNWWFVEWIVSGSLAFSFWLLAKWSKMIKVLWKIGTCVQYCCIGQSSPWTSRIILNLLNRREGVSKCANRVLGGEDLVDPCSALRYNFETSDLRQKFQNHSGRHRGRLLLFIASSFPPP